MLQVKQIKYTVRSQMGNKTKFIIQQVDFSLEAGYMLCLLGKNGSGKSTLLKLLYGIMPVEQGSITWKGQEVYKKSDKVRQEVAYVGEESGFFESKSIPDNIALLSLLYPNFQYDKWEHYLNLFGLERIKKEQTFQELSTGQKRQVQLAFALARSPRLLLLDEPTGNLDPIYRMEFMELLQELVAKEEISVILATHILEEVEEVADYIGLMHQGKLVLFGDRIQVLEEAKAESFEDIMGGLKVKCEVDEDEC
jgi:ABC-2 type transport system ATP-binding protein